MIEIKNLKKSFGNHIIFDDTNFIVDKVNTINCIIGPSGAGKTTLFQIMFGLDMDFEGTYLINGVNAKELTIKDWEMLRTNYIQIVYQDFKLLENFTVYENMLFAANNNNAKSKIDKLLKDMNLERIKNSKVIKISGGEKQRLALARALILNPKVILLDEPTGNLDNDNTSIIMEQIKKMAENGVSIIIITHDLRVIPYCDNIFEIDNKKIISRTKQTVEDNLEQQSFPIEIAKCNKKIRSLKYAIKRFKANLMDVLLANLPIIVIFIVFISIFGLIYVKPVSIFITLFFKSIFKNEKDRNEIKIGRYIGYLERFIIFLLCLFDSISTIGFILAAKTLVRYKDINNNEDNFQEKYLIGTLLSTIGALCCFALVKYIE